MAGLACRRFGAQHKRRFFREQITNHRLDLVTSEFARVW
jgi:hypothetical protein